LPGAPARRAYAAPRPGPGRTPHPPPPPARRPRFPGSPRNPRPRPVCVAASSSAHHPPGSPPEPCCTPLVKVLPAGSPGGQEERPALLQGGSRLPRFRGCSNVLW